MTPHVSFASDWTMDLGDYHNSGKCDEVIEPPLKVLWSFSDISNERQETEFKKNPLIYQDTIIAISGNGFVYSVDLKNGSLNWKKKIYSGTGTQDVRYSSAISYPYIILDQGNKIFFLDFETGEIVDEVKVNGTIRSNVLLKDGIALFNTDPYRDYLIHAINISSREILWVNKGVLSSLGFDHLQ